MSANDSQVAAALVSIKAALDLQNQIDALRAPQMAAIQHAVDVLQVMDPGGTPKVTVYNQRDPVWANVHMGTAIGTIGAVGCLITSVASMLTDAGHPIKPDTLNAWLIQNGGYVDGNKFVFASIDKLGVTKYTTRIDCPATPAPMSQLDAEIAASNFVIIKVDNGYPPDYHWVRYLGGGKMADPWYGDIASIVPRYHGASAAVCIRAALLYKRVTA